MFIIYIVYDLYSVCILYTISVLVNDTIVLKIIKSSKA